MKTKNQGNGMVYAATLALVIGFTLGQLASAQATQPSVPVTLIKAQRLLDPRTGDVLSPAAVLIENGKIKEVGPAARVQSAAPAGVETIDLGDATLLPGLIDAHTHLFLDIIVPPEEEIQRHKNGLFGPGDLLAIVESPSKRAFLGAQMAREDLESGITTVRNLGHSGIDGDTELRDAINAGRITGPRVLAAGRKLIAQGSYLQNLNPALSAAILNQEFLLLDGVDSADLVAVAGDPIADITELERVRFVVKNGQVVRNELSKAESPARR